MIDAGVIKNRSLFAIFKEPFDRRKPGLSHAPYVEISYQSFCVDQPAYGGVREFFGRTPSVPLGQLSLKRDVSVCIVVAVITTSS